MNRIALAVSAVLLSALCGARPPQDDSPKAESPKAEPKGETAVAKRENLKVELKLEGTFEPAERHAIQVKPAAWSGELTVSKVAAHGSKVKKGDTILQIDGTKLAEAIAAAQIDLTGARVQHDRGAEEARLAAVGDVLQKERVERDAREVAERLKHYTEVDMELALKEAEMGLQWQQDSIADQKEELDQLEKMYKSEELTSATADIVLKRAQRNLKRSQERLELSLKRLHRTKTYEIPQQLEQYRFDERDKAHALEVYRKTSPLQKIEREANLLRAKANLKQQEENLAKLRKDEAALAVAAPADGIVWYGQFEGGAWSNVEETLKNLRVGEKVQAQQPLMTLVTGDLCVKTAVAEDKLTDVPAGTEAQVHPVAFPETTLAAKARAPVLVGARKGEAFDTRFDLAAGDPRLVPGLKAKLTVLVAELKDVITVPASAVTEEASRKFVKVLEGGKPVPREVVTGKTSGEKIEIKSGLKEGEEVVLGGGPK
jgi:multidrug resistance efflux pump